MIKRYLSIGLMAAMLAGCSILPTKRTESAGVKTSEAISAQHDLTIESVFNSAVRATNGGSIRIESHAAQDAGATEAIRSTFARTIPVGVSMILFGVGGIIICIAIWLIRRSSTAADAAYRAADSGMARAINLARQKAVAAIDHREIAEAQQIIAELEAERGKLAGAR